MFDKINLPNAAIKEGRTAFSQQELQTITKQFDDPEFRTLFAEYAREISDPKAKAENEAHLQQIESEGQAEAVYGKGVQLIIPQPSFVVKTKDAAKQKRVYINICTCEKVGKMEFKLTPGPTPRRHLQLPMLLKGKPEEGTAADGGPVEAWDLVLHPDAPAAAQLDPALCNTIVTMAIERVEQASTKLLRSYKLPSLAYKSLDGTGKPAVMALRTEQGGEVVDGRLRPMAGTTSTSSNAAKANDTSAAAVTAAAAASIPPAGRSSFSFGSKAEAKRSAKGVKAPDDASQPGYRHPCGAVTPSWQLVERRRVDLSNSWADTGRTFRPLCSQPKALVARVDLPGVASPDEVAVDLGPDGQVLEVAVPGKFLLRGLRLPFKVTDERGTANFNKAKQQLELTLPTVAPEQPEPDVAPALELAAGAGAQQQHAGEQIASKHTQQQQHNCSTPLCLEQAQHQQSSELSGMEQPCAQQAAVVACEAAASAVVQRSGCAKSANQQRWQELHSTVDAVSVDAGSDETKHQRPDQQQQQQQEAEQPEPSFTTVSKLPPRYVHNRVEAADLD